MKKYDVAIALRVYPKIAKQPIGNFSDKFELFRVSLFSLMASLADLRARFYVILDSCDNRYEALAASMINAEDLEIEKVERAGNERTFLMQMDWLLKQPYADKVYFAEDDYIYRPNLFSRMLNVLDHHQPAVHFVSPHNHGDYYHNTIQQVAGTRLMFAAGCHWHLPVSTCLTFLSTRGVLAATRKVMRTYKRRNTDFAIFVALVKPSLFLLPPLSLWRNTFFLKNLAKAHFWTWQQLYFGRRYKLAVPVDAVGTHMQYDEVGPGIDWDGLIQDYLRRRPISNQ
jgi:hypothetical protein